MKAKPRVLLESRYRKLERGLPQTIHFCPACGGRRRRRANCGVCEGRGRISDDSVQQLLSRRILRAFDARKCKFHGAGREDVDVLMLGHGRPFIFELEEPKTEDVDLEALRDKIHAEVGERIQLTVPFLRVDRRRVGQIKEAHWSKRYRIGVEVEGELPADVAEQLAARKFLVRQRTPARVAHRRADMVRTRQIEILAARAPGPDHPLELDIETSHGAYVKEWVSGDEGRSEPSLAELLEIPAVCERLDVLEILDEAGQAHAAAGGSDDGPVIPPSATPQP